MREYTGPNTLLKAFQLIRQALKNAVPSAGDGIDITETEAGPEISVSLPVKAVTKAQYDALTEAEKQADVLYAVTDDNPGGSSGGGGSGGNSGEVYSTEEIRIGTWLDGKPLYRKVIFYTTGSTTGRIDETIPLPDLEDIETVVTLKSILSNNGGEFVIGSGFDDTRVDIQFLVFYSPGSLFVRRSGKRTASSQTTTTIEYTKTTDTSEGGTV